MNSTEILELVETLEAYVVHAVYGKAILQSHSLELSLKNLLFTKLADKQLSEGRFKSEVARIKRLTMGRLIEEVIANFEISDYWQEEFDNALFFRNRLVHQISEALLNSHFKEDGKTRLVSEIEDITRYFRESKAEIERIIDQWLSLNGIEKSKLLEIVKSWSEQPKVVAKTATANETT